MLLRVQVVLVVISAVTWITLWACIREGNKVPIISRSKRVMKFFMGFWILSKIPTAALSQLYSHVKKTLRKDLESVTKTEANRSAWLIAEDNRVFVSLVFD